MVKRLTEQKTTKGITRVVVRSCVCEFQTVLNKLCAFEDIMEKYGFQSVEELDDFFVNYKVSDILTEERIKEIAVNEQRKVFQSMIKEIVEKECNNLYNELNTWKKACELACQIIISGYCDGMDDETDWESVVFQWKEDNGIKTYGIGVEELLGYLLEQSQKNMEANSEKK